MIGLLQSLFFHIGPFGELGFMLSIAATGIYLGVTG